MSTAWMVVEVALGVLGSLLVWFTVAGIVTRAVERHRDRTGHHGNRPSAPL